MKFEMRINWLVQETSANAHDIRKALFGTEHRRPTLRAERSHLAGRRFVAAKQCFSGREFKRACVDRNVRRKRAALSHAALRAMTDLDGREGASDAEFHSTTQARAVVNSLHDFSLDFREV